MSEQLTHLDEHGRARMVDVGHKDDTARVATARGAVHMQPETLQQIIAGNMKKGDVLTVAELAGVMAAKRTSDLIPLCHPLMLNHITVTCTPNPAQSCVEIEATVRLKGKTGVEMEALTAVTIAGLTIYDMAKAIDKGMRLTDVRLVRKEGGKTVIGNQWSVAKPITDNRLPITDMELNIRLFATLKDRAGQGHILVRLDEPATVQTLLAAIVDQYPALATAVASSIVSVNKAFAGEDTAVRPGDEIAIFPPVSGGDWPHPTYFAITTAAVDINAIHQRLTAPDVGAIVTFTGAVRGQTNRQGLPDATIHLEYEAYEEMAEQKMVQIAQEIWARWPLVKGIAIVQRIGALQVGDMTTFVACAAAHRDQGVFDAARYGIDRLKEIVPVWKKEVGPDQSVWVEGHYHPTEQDNLSP